MVVLKNNMLNLNENMIALNKEQFSKVMKEQLSKENGLNDVFKLILEILMLNERSEVLSNDPNNKGNGYRYRNCIGFGSSFKISIPRDRLGLFNPFILEVLKEDESRIKDTAFELYAKGLTTKDVGSIIKKLYGKEYSESSISNITQGFYKQMEEWRNRPLEKNYSVLYIDSIFIKVRRDTVQSEAFYVILGIKEDKTREVLGIYNYPTESSTNWIEIFKSLETRGVKNINLVVSDGLAGIEGAIKQIYPKTPLQTCIVHYIRGKMNEIRPKDKNEFGRDMKQVFNPNIYDDTIDKAKKRLYNVSEKWKTIYPKLSKKLREDVENKDILFEYINYEYRIRPMIYTTNWIERLNKKFRKTLKVRGALPTIESVLVLLSKTSIDIENETYSYPISMFNYDTKLFKFE